MLNIDQEALCDFCEDQNERMNRNNCEGCCCSETQEAFLDNCGITDESTRTFKNLCVGEKVYQLIHEPIIPKMKICTVNSIAQAEAGKNPLRFLFENAYVNVSEITSNKASNYFLYKKRLFRQIRSYLYTKNT